MNRLIANALPTDRIFAWPDYFRIALAPHLQKTKHAAHL